MLLRKMPLSEAATDFIITVAPNPKPQQGRNQRISALKSTSKNRHGKIRTGPKTGVEFRFYQRHEWSKLSKEEQDKVREIRQEEIKQQGTKRKAADKALKRYFKEIGVPLHLICDQAWEQVQVMPEFSVIALAREHYFRLFAGELLFLILCNAPAVIL